MKQQTIFKGQMFQAKEQRDKRNIDSRLNSSLNRIVGRVKVMDGKRKAIFPKSFSLGWLGTVINQ